MLNLNDLQLFAHVVEHGGFSAAARRLGVPKSTLSKRLHELETALGARLLHRTSRSLALTDVGRAVHDHARAAAIACEAAQDVVASRRAEPSGTVRLTASVPVAQTLLAEPLPLLARAHPRLRLELDVTDRFVDLVAEGFDIAVRSHFGPLPDSGLTQRRIASDGFWLLASPAYLQQRGMPAAPWDLVGHDALLASATASGWTLQPEAGGEAVPVRVPSPRLVANESSVLLAAAAAGLGITTLPSAMCREAAADGRLVRVLPGWLAGRVTTTLLMPGRRSELPAVRAVVDFLAAHVGDVSA